MSDAPKPMSAERMAEIRESVMFMRARLSYTHQTWTKADACTRLVVDDAEALLDHITAVTAERDEARRERDAYAALDCSVQHDADKAAIDAAIARAERADAAAKKADARARFMEMAASAPTPAPCLNCGRCVLGGACCETPNFPPYEPGPVADLVLAYREEKARAERAEAERDEALRRITQIEAAAPLRNDGFQDP